jgi:MtN3 and saliva related transmembrane protein
MTLQFISIEPVGFVAGLITTSCVFPQIYKIFRTKSAIDVSIFMFIMMLLGQILWTIHAFLISNLTLMIFTGVSILTSVLIIFMKIHYDHKKRIIEAYNLNTFPY